MIGQNCTDGPERGQDRSDEEDKNKIRGEKIRGRESMNKVRQHS